MGTRFELVLQGDDLQHLRAAGEAAIDVIESLHLRFSRFDNGSLVNHLRRAGGGAPVSIDRQTWDLFADALSVQGASAGIFDPARGTSPTGRGIELDAEALTVRLASPAVELDFGAIAKGHALDVARGVVREAGIESAFLHGGTSSGYGMGRPAGMHAWRIAPRADGGTDTAPVLELVDRAFSVSSEGDGTQALVAGVSGRLTDAWATALALGAGVVGLPHDLEAWIRTARGPWRSARAWVGAVA
jgi:thiamine biosynthesis lipoprotein